MLDDKDFRSLKSLDGLFGKQLIATFADVKFFVKETPGIQLSEVSRRILLDKLGLYGAFEAVSFLQKNPEADLNEIKSHLDSVCGISQITSAVITHFGKRATTLKTRNSLTSVLHAISIERAKQSDSNLINVLDNINNQLSSTLFSIREYELWDILSKIYEGKIHLADSEAIVDLKNVAGEKGTSATNKLGLTTTVPVEEMISIAKSKSKIWASKYTLARMRNKREIANIYRILSSAFGDLEVEIVSAQEEIQKAEWILRHNNEYLFSI